MKSAFLCPLCKANCRVLPKDTPKEDEKKFSLSFDKMNTNDPFDLAYFSALSHRIDFS